MTFNPGQGSLRVPEEESAMPPADAAKPTPPPTEGDAAPDPGRPAARASGMTPGAFLAALPHGAALRAAELRRSPEWTFGDLPPICALAHAACEFAADLARRPLGWRGWPDAERAVLNMCVVAFARVALERAALEGDEHDAHAFTVPDANPPLDEEVRRRAQERVDAALAGLAA